METDQDRRNEFFRIGIPAELLETDQNNRNEFFCIGIPERKVYRSLPISVRKITALLRLLDNRLVTFDCLNVFVSNNTVVRKFSKSSILYYYLRSEHHHPRITVCLLQDLNSGRLTRGTSYCSNLDQISKENGRNRARDRALYAQLGIQLPKHYGDGRRDEVREIWQECHTSIDNRKPFPQWTIIQRSNELTGSEHRLIDKNGWIRQYPVLTTVKEVKETGNGEAMAMAMAMARASVTA